DASQTLNDFYNAQEKLRFSRIPIYENTIDNVVGIILKDDLFEGIIKGHGDWPLSKIKKEVLAVNQDKVLPEILDALTKSRSHLAIVVDEFGGLSGIVTMEDVFETLLGLEIVDEADAEADLQALARKRWEERAKQIGLIP
ncbi:MAG: CBS domain-containing protein, partial [Bacteroidota bacterium]